MEDERKRLEIIEKEEKEKEIIIPYKFVNKFVNVLYYNATKNPDGTLTMHEPRLAEYEDD